MTESAMHRPTRSFPIVPALAAVIVAAMGPLIWIGLYRALGGNIWLPALCIGVVVGLAVRLTSRGPDARLSWIAAALTFLACFAGYMVTGLYFIQWTQPVTFAGLLQFFLNDIRALIMIALGCYLAHVISTRHA